jgi:hypothetical protein
LKEVQSNAAEKRKKDESALEKALYHFCSTPGTDNHLPVLQRGAKQRA